MIIWIFALSNLYDDHDVYNSTAVHHLQIKDISIQAASIISPGLYITFMLNLFNIMDEGIYDEVCDVYVSIYTMSFRKCRCSL